MEPIQVGTVFDGSTQGVFTRINHVSGTISLAQARYGRDWQVNGDGELLRLRIRSKQNTIKSPLHLRVGKIVRSDYSIVNLTMHELDLSTSLPEVFTLQQNYPNPFNPSTQIRYSLPVSSNVKVVVYNMLGSKVRTLYNGNQDAGYRSVMWNATNDMGRLVSAGVYIYSIQAGDFVQNRKMVLMK